MGIIMNPGTSEQELVVIGAYSYKTSDTMQIVTYKADRKGYMPKVMFTRRKKPYLLDDKLLQSLVGWFVILLDRK